MCVRSAVIRHIHAPAPPTVFFTTSIYVIAFVVPSRAPTSVAVVVLNSTTLSVSWQPLDPQFHNGILQYYHVQIVELVTSSVIEVNENLTHIVISSLHPYYEYNVTVAAATVVGTGPFSSPLTTTTAEDSESCCAILTIKPH